MSLGESVTIFYLVPFMGVILTTLGVGIVVGSYVGQRTAGVAAAAILTVGVGALLAPVYLG